MKLRELDGRLMRHSIEPASPSHGRPMPDGTTQWGGFPVSVFRTVATLAEADRVSFLCPLCFVTNSGKVGTHRCAVDFEGKGTPDEACIHNDAGQPVRWTAEGSTIDDLTLRPSILLLGGCGWHGFVTNGEAA